MKTGFASLKLALAGFIIPYLFVYNPVMLMIDTTDVAVNAKDFPMAPISSIILIPITAIIGIIALSAAAEGFFKSNLNWILRIVLAIGALCLIIPETYTDLIGFIIVAVILGYDFIRTKKQSTIAA